MSDSRKVIINAFPAELEGEARALYDHALAATEPALRSVPNPMEMLKTDRGFARAVTCAAQAGFSRAQDHIANRLQGASVENPLPPATRAMYRCTMDSIAWQIIQYQLYIARRLFQGQRPPNIENSNFSSVRRAAAHLTSDDHSKFALISDLTSFVQVGDLLVIDVDGGISLVEVKEGETNRRVVEFAQSFAQSGCSRALQFFRQTEGEHTFKQLGRFLRQAARLSHVAEVMNKGEGTDPDHEVMIRTPEIPLVLEGYDAELVSVLGRSKGPGWAIEHIDNCLFLGAYRSETRGPAKVVFRAWFEDCDGDKQFPFANLFSASARTPLALPIACRNIPREDKFDLMFGRVVVFVAIGMNRFIDLCNSLDLPARWSSRKEAERLKRGKQMGVDQPWTCNKRAILIGEKGREAALYGGIFVRMMNHGTRPASAVAILRSLYRIDNTA